MRILVIGGGGREHALVWKLAQSPRVEKIYVAPGNPGMSAIAECISLPLGDWEKVAVFALEQKIDLTVVGPEAPLVEGIADVFKARFSYIWTNSGSSSYRRFQGFF
ncbi:MAG: phosphoribosylamine--glycine ligase N-terminal domain-containing protein [Acidaminococcaceae bacterium]